MRRRKATVELFEEIRREYEFGIGTIQGVARKFGVHRRLVREALSERSAAAEGGAGHEPRPRLEPVAGFIDAILEADRQAPRKQRHTAHRIYVRLRQERPGHPIAESTVRRVRPASGRRRWGCARARDVRAAELRLGQRGAGRLVRGGGRPGGERVKLQVFALRSMASGAAFHRAYRHATQQAFLEAHELAFRYFGGVFRRLRYDNLDGGGEADPARARGARRRRASWRSARTGGSRRSSARRPRGMRRAGSRTRSGGSGGTTGCRCPRARDLEDLNAQLLAACQADEARTIDGREQTVGDGAARSSASTCCRWPRRASTWWRSASRPSTSLGCVKVKTNAYSVPVRPAPRSRSSSRRPRSRSGTRAARRPSRALLRPASGDPRPGALPGRAGAQAGRAGRQQAAGAVARARPLAGQLRPVLAGADRAAWAAGRDQGDDRAAAARADATGRRRLRAAIEAALVLGCTDAAAVRHLRDRRRAWRMPGPPALEVGAAGPVRAAAAHDATSTTTCSAWPGVAR